MYFSAFIPTLNWVYCWQQYSRRHRMNEGVKFKSYTKLALLSNEAKYVDSVSSVRVASFLTLQKCCFWMATNIQINNWILYHEPYLAWPYYSSHIKVVTLAVRVTDLSWVHEIVIQGRFRAAVVISLILTYVWLPLVSSRNPEIVS